MAETRLSAEQRERLTALLATDYTAEWDIGPGAIAEVKKLLREISADVAAVLRELAAVEKERDEARAILQKLGALTEDEVIKLGWGK